MQQETSDLIIGFARAGTLEEYEIQAELAKLGISVSVDRIETVLNERVW